MKVSHLNGLRALEAALRCGSFSAAAEELAITPAAVGQRIRALEAYLGRELFQRTATGARPTAEALKIQPLLTAGFSDLEKALQDLGVTSEPRNISVTMPESFSENWFAPVISEFTGAHPDMTLHLEASNRDHDLLAEDFDYAIRYGKPLGAPFEETDLFGDSVQPVCSPEFAERHGLDATARDLGHVPLIHILNRTSDPGWVGFEGWGRVFAVDTAQLGHGVRFARTASGLQSAIAGQGLMMAGLVESYRSLATGKLVMPFGASNRSETSYRYRLVRRPGKPLSRAQTEFRTWVISQASTYRRDVANLLARLTG